MVTAYPINVTDIVGVLHYVNSVTDNKFSISILIIIFFITYLPISRSDSTNAFVVASFLTFITTLFMIPAGLIGSEFIVITLILLAIGGFLLYTRD